MSKHTPGPWWVAASGSFKVATITSTIGIYADQMPKEESETDARLIAAAPELLQALKFAVQQNEHDILMTGEELRQCRAAIAKATGEPA